MSEKIVNIKYINSQNEEFDEIILFNKDYEMFLNSCFEKFAIENEKNFLFFIYNNVKYKISNQEEYSKIVDNTNEFLLNFVITKNEMEEIGEISKLIENFDKIENNNNNNNISLNNISVNNISENKINENNNNNNENKINENNNKIINNENNNKINEINENINEINNKINNKINEINNNNNVINNNKINEINNNKINDNNNNENFNVKLVETILDNFSSLINDFYLNITKNSNLNKEILIEKIKEFENNFKDGLKFILNDLKTSNENNINKIIEHLDKIEKKNEEKNIKKENETKNHRKILNKIVTSIFNDVKQNNKILNEIKMKLNNNNNKNEFDKIKIINLEEELQISKQKNKEIENNFLHLFEEKEQIIENEKKENEFLMNEIERKNLLISDLEKKIQQKNNNEND